MRSRRDGEDNEEAVKEQSGELSHIDWGTNPRQV